MKDMSLEEWDKKVEDITCIQLEMLRGNGYSAAKTVNVREDQEMDENLTLDQRVGRLIGEVSAKRLDEEIVGLLSDQYIRDSILFPPPSLLARILHKLLLLVSRFWS